MPSAYDLTTLDPRSFEHLSNAIAMRVLGAGHTGFAPGPDGGRDGYFQGPAPYPSEVNCWDGDWYIQAKFHAPHLSHDPQKWLLDCVNDEIKAFQEPHGPREWPDNWILITNVDPTANPKTGSFDRARALVRKARHQLVERFHIWGGTKIIEFLSQFPDIAERYGHFLSPGHVISRLCNELGDARASGETVLKHLIVAGLEDHKHTKLEQAGSEADKRPGIHKLFVDLPFACGEHQVAGLATQFLASAASQVQRLDPVLPSGKSWLQWRRHPSRAPVWFIKGGPGQGKSTIGQYFCQVQRAALILQGDGLHVHPEVRQLAEDIRASPHAKAIWPAVPRIPIQVELKEYAKWYAERAEHEPRGVLTYLSTVLAAQIEQDVAVGTLRRLLAARSWVVVFDGLDEVPATVKDALAKEVHTLLRETAAGADILTICTSRPQGYAGQFDSLYGIASAELTKLPPQSAFDCGALLIKHTLPRTEADRAVDILRTALTSPAVQELMTTPLQAHIMAIIVRGGQRPPERKWELYNRFYDVIRAREANRELPDKALASLLREDVALLKAVHNRLGFLLHSEAERAQGAQAKLSRVAFRSMVEAVVRDQKEHNIAEITETVLSATTERLVLISTPDDGAHVRFDVRQLQEYFAAEYLYHGATPETLAKRLDSIIGDAHWREVVHFLLSALALGNRKAELAIACQALRATDDGDIDSVSRALAAALARGGFVASGLLRDGVLEADKGVRNYFKDIVARLASIRDPEALAPLRSIRGMASQAWITELMARCVREFDAKASLGAALYLVHALPDGHPLLPTFLSNVRSSPPWYRRAIAEASVVAHANQAGVQSWTIDLLAEATAQWPLADVVGARLFARMFETSDVADSIGQKLRDRFGRGISDLLGVYRRQRHHRREGLSREDYGWLTLGLASFEPLENPDVRAFAKRALGAPVGGLAGLLAAGTHFACFQDKRSYVEVLLALGEEWGAVYELPADIYTRIPRPVESSPRKVAELVREMTDQRFADSIAGGAFGALQFQRDPIFEVSSGERGAVSKERIAALFAKYPEWAVMWWARQAGCGDNVALSSDVTETAVTAALEVNAARHELSASVWGIAFSGSRGAALRERVVADPPGRLVTFGRWWLAEEVQFRPVALELPREAALLPRLASDIVAAHTSLGSESAFRRSPVAGRDERVQACCSIVEAYLPTACAVESVARGVGHGLDVRAAAVLLLMLHPRGDQGAAPNFAELFITSAARGLSAGTALGATADLLHLERDPAMSGVLGAVIESMPGESREWPKWDRLLARWRERSTAPVTSRGVGHFLTD